MKKICFYGIASTIFYIFSLYASDVKDEKLLSTDDYSVMVRAGRRRHEFLAIESLKNPAYDDDHIIVRVVFFNSGSKECRTMTNVPLSSITAPQWVGDATPVPARYATWPLNYYVIQAIDEKKGVLIPISDVIHVRWETAEEVALNSHAGVGQYLLSLYSIWPDTKQVVKYKNILKKG